MDQIGGADDISEAEIETNFKSYRPYIESCVKTMDLLVFFKLFTTEQVKTLYKKAKVDPVGAIQEAFDIISDMKNTLYKFHHLLSALEEAEYPKIVRLLTGELIRVHDNHRQKLKTFAVDIFQRLCISELLPYLLTKQVLNNNDVDEIASIEKSESRGSAVMLLLSLLPNRNRDWYKHFLWGLFKSKQKDLAELIDQNMTENLDKAEELGTEDVVDDPSLKVSAKAFHQWLDREGLELQIPQQQKQRLKRVESMPTPHVLSGQSMEDSDSTEGDQKSIASQSKITPLFDCNPCRRKDCEVAAICYCRKCGDYLCQYCEDVHKRLGATQSHDTVLIHFHTKVNQEENHMLSCSCGAKMASFYCRSHKNLACFGCREKCHSLCEILSIKDLDQRHHEKTDVDKCAERYKILKKRLRKLDFDRETDHAKLNVSIESTKRNVTTFSSDLHKLIHDQNAAVLNEISKLGERQKLYICSCREICRLLIIHLDSRLDKLLKTRETNDYSNNFIITLKVDKFIEDAEHITEKMELTEYVNTIDIDMNEDLEALLRGNGISKVSGQNTIGESAMTIDQKDAEIQTMDLNYMKQFLCDSCCVDPNYLEPYLQHIQTPIKQNKTQMGLK